MLLDPSVHRQTYVEDCEVCCNPIEVSPEFLNTELLSIDINMLGQ